MAQSAGSLVFIRPVEVLFSKLKPLFAFSAVCLSLSVSSVGETALIDPDLKEIFSKQMGSKILDSQRVEPRGRILVSLHADESQIYSPEKYRTREVVSYLKELTRMSLDALRHDLSRVSFDRNDIRIERAFWINQSLVMDVNRSGLEVVSHLPSVHKIYKIREVRTLSPISMERSDKDLTTPWPLEQIGMDRVFSKDPSLNGEGVIIGSVDTGVDPNHESLRGKIISFFDTKRREVTFPVDRGGHGTHTIGTMIGGETDTLDRIGVAPAAKLVAAGSLGSVDDVFAGMEHMLDPDGNPDTDDFPRVINNSWGGTGKSLEVLYKAITAWEASGILAVFAAGNSGDGPMTVTKPSEHPSVLTVAALDRDGMVTDFSSRGPASFESRRLQKPDLSAPGKDVRSAIPGNKYAKYSGTSMAAPHVAGVAALLIQRFPSLNPRQLRGILVLSAKRKNELGELDSSATWNPAYGHGQVSAPDALNLAQRVNGGGTSPFELATPFLKSPFALKADQISAMDTVFSSKRALFSSVQGPAGSKNSFREAIQWQSPDQFFN